MTLNRVHAWEDILDDEIRAIHHGLDARRGLGRKVAVLCVDNLNSVFGDRAEPVVDMIKRFPNGCGLAAWNAIAPTQALLQAARASGVMIIHSTRDPAPQPIKHRIAAVKWTSNFVNAFPDGSDRHFFPALAPLDDELVIHKRRASVFFGTPLAAYLVEAGVDSLICCGNSTSGCVRATVVDAFNLGFRVAVVEECTFDRTQASHAMSLYDLDAKYADVMALDDILAYMASPDVRTSRRAA